MQQHGAAVAQPQQQLSAAQLCDTVLPPALQAFLPAAGQQAARAALLAGAPLPPALLADTAALRGTFALLLRSLAAGDAQHNLLGAASAANPPRQARMVGQLRRLLLLCCASIGAASSGAAADPLLQAAAGRLAGILCDAAQWKCFPSGVQDEQRRWLQRQLQVWLAPLPLPVAAAQRLVAGLAPQTDVGSSEAALRQQNQQQQQQQRQQLASVLSGLVVAQVQLWRQLQALAGSGGEGEGEAKVAAQAAQQQLLTLLSTPGLLSLLTPAATAQLTTAANFAALAAGAAQWQAPSGGSGAAAAQQRLCLLGALVQLAAGRKASTPRPSAAGQTEAGRQLEFLPASALLQQPGVAAALGSAAVALLPPAVDACSGAAAGRALERDLWPLAEGTFAAQLLQLLPLPQFARVYHLLLLLADSARSSGSRGGSRGGQLAAARLLSALAFGTQLLPAAWRQLATSVGLPLEAPMQATRGWEVPTLRRGIAGLAPEAAAELGLFCRCGAALRMGGAERAVSSPLPFACAHPPPSRHLLTMRRAPLPRTLPLYCPPPPGCTSTCSQ